LLSGGPSFISFVMPDFISITPGLADLGLYTVTVVLSDGLLQSTFPLQVTITNAPPTSTSNLNQYFIQDTSSVIKT
jgi:hypothetical protein